MQGGWQRRGNYRICPGGGGIGFGSIGSEDIMGGRSGGGKSKGPKTQKDPTRKFDFTKISAGDTDMGFRSIYNDDGLIISSKIFDSPGNGTFHAQWLEDA